MLTDEQFLKFTRAAADGGINPGLDLGLPAEIVSRASDTSDMRANMWILYAMVRGMQESNREVRVLELGTNDGTSTIPLLKAVSEKPGGHVDSVDIVDVVVAKAIVNHLGLAPWWTFTQGDSCAVMKAMRDAGRQFDIIFIDSSHSYEPTKQELDHAKAMLVPGGILLSHDNWCGAVDVHWDRPMGQRGTPGSGVVAHEMMTGNEWVGVVFPFGCNLGIFRRRADCVGEIESALAAARKEGFIP